MRRSAWALAAVSVSIASPAMAQGVTLARGEEVVLEISDDDLADAALGPASATPFEVALGRQVGGVKLPEAPVTQGQPMPHNSALPAAPVPVAGQARFRFLPVPETGGSLLIIHNGYAKALSYQARITSKGKAQPTDVCLVVPGKLGVEYWPYAISAIEVSAFKLVDWKAEDGVPCK
ncbi:hypothetical protein P6144_07865 [Sphingomonas sp. HITSZ_GF]|uniref:hypothetical protein n=1 Tax=Sphingomonas sp. HITSZ_GF TaxID=3037247 RepID=UPI00240E5DCC|nr:hypothetical protein [Sphingomonas sp. HITSZ_GF]MDG2533557.1 hypothetical protein [Sphingomonas sp. HITSZ_GF]